MDSFRLATKAMGEELTVDELKQYITAGKDVNYQEAKFGYTALINTAYSGHTELVQMLLDAYADVDIQNRYGYTALHYAAGNNHPLVLVQLIKARADVNIQNARGSTALHSALNYGHMACTLLLLDAEANLWLENNFREIPMSLGLQRQHSNDEMMRFFIEHGTCEDIGFTALMEASRRGYVPALKKLLALGANVYAKDKYGTTALDVASSEECTMLLRQHTMISAPLPPPPELPEQDVLGEESMVDKAWRKVLTVDELRQYIAAGKDVNYQDAKFGYTALINTAYSGHTELVQMLLDAYADVNIQNRYGYTALRYAAGNNHPLVLVQLIKARADVNMQNNDGNTALHLALNYGHMACTLLLLDAEANLWLETRRGETAMSLGFF